MSELRKSIVPDVERPWFDRVSALAAAGDVRPLLPQLHQRDGAPVTGSVSLAGATKLSHDRWLGVFRLADGGSVAAPFAIHAGALMRARPGDGAAASLIAQLAAGQRENEDGFIFRSFVTDGWPTVGRGVTERPMLVDQTHESVVVGEQAVVKWAVRAEPTPAPVLIEHLGAAGFTQMAQPWGFVSWPEAPGELLVASVVQYLPDASDGWTWAVADATDFAARGVELGPAVSGVTAVGRVAADMHVAMATPTSVNESPVSVADNRELMRWRDLGLSLLDDAIDAVDGPEGARLASLRPALAEAIGALELVDETTTIPVHGDLHVGQVLRWDDGFALGDFDGNPVLEVAERLSAQPAARDVAGMLQSIDHVGRVVLRRVEGADPDLVHAWIFAAQQSFLGSYRSRLTQCASEALLDERLLLAFQVEQECREFLYAVRHLPRWRYVPDQALQALFGHA